MLPFRMSAYVLTNLVVTAGMLTPGLQVSNCAIRVPLIGHTNILTLTSSDYRHPSLANW